MTQTTPIFPHTGIRVHKNAHDITVMRLHYEADPAKGEGQKVYVKELDRELSPWAYQAYKAMTEQDLYMREYEIEAEATLGALIFHLDDEATLEPSFPIPPTWTRRMSLDPHPSVPHAFLWVATDPWGERWYYREMWPSQSCWRYNANGKLSGKPGPCPENEPIVRIQDYVGTMKWLESADNAENVHQGKRFDENIHARVIDYAARAFGQGTNDDQEQPNFQQRYEMYMMLPETRVTCPTFDDAKKDRDVGFEMVNAGLKPHLTLTNDDKRRKRSRIHIFKDKCPELVWQLKNNRRQQLTAVQALAKDPTGKIVPVRTHMTDNMRYLEMSNPIYINPERPRSTWHQQHEGIAY
jgi:hypothetical protein